VRVGNLSLAPSATLSLIAPVSRVDSIRAISLPELFQKTFDQLAEKYYEAQVAEAIESGESHGLVYNMHSLTTRWR
jgi:hypothetical protein